MKRRKFLKYAHRFDCDILREGGSHSILINRNNDLQSPLPRHPEIKPSMVRQICKQLGIPTPREK